ncbi:hypothetical protein GGX14DRAFT_563059 [Mycena pura]|uniref:Uncharacterized protein n=1 Tax=Mycena pura TaxID=153505 RepID=A0AAD6VJQ6_9AGAR|nr:hypothetical protein GGX14DRAFT_563059 [Mycena pura]
MTCVTSRYISALSTTPSAAATLRRLAPALPPGDTPCRCPAARSLERSARFRCPPPPPPCTSLARSMPTSKAIDLQVVANKKALNISRSQQKFFGNRMDVGSVSTCRRPASHACSPVQPLGNAPYRRNRLLTPRPATAPHRRCPALPLPPGDAPHRRRRLHRTFTRAAARRCPVPARPPGNAPRRCPAPLLPPGNAPCRRRRPPSRAHVHPCHCDRLPTPRAAATACRRPAPPLPPADALRRCRRPASRVHVHLCRRDRLTTPHATAAAPHGVGFDARRRCRPVPLPPTARAHSPVPLLPPGDAPCRRDHLATPRAAAPHRRFHLAMPRAAAAALHRTRTFNHRLATPHATAGAWRHPAPLPHIVASAWRRPPPCIARTLTRVAATAWRRPTPPLAWRHSAPLPRIAASAWRPHATAAALHHARTLTHAAATAWRRPTPPPRTAGSASWPALHHLRAGFDARRRALCRAIAPPAQVRLHRCTNPARVSTPGTMPCATPLHRPRVWLCRPPRCTTPRAGFDARRRRHPHAGSRSHERQACSWCPVPHAAYRQDSDNGQ